MDFRFVQGPKLHGNMTETLGKMHWWRGMSLVTLGNKLHLLHFFYLFYDRCFTHYKLNKNVDAL